MSSGDTTVPESHRDYNIAKEQQEALILAIERNDIAETRRMLEAGVSPNSIFGDLSPLLQAVFSRNQEIIRLLFHHGVQDHWDELLSATELHAAARVGDVEVLRLVLDYWQEKGYVIDTARGTSAPIHLAAEDGHLECVKLLEQAEGPEVVHAPSYHLRMTTLHAACEARPPRGPDVIRYLLSQGLDINAVNSSSECPLLLAIRKDNVGSIEELVIRASPAANLDTRNRFGETCLHAAAYHCSLEIVQMLVRAGADIHARSTSNGSVLHRAVEAGRMDSVQWILENSDLQVNERGTSDWTPLHYAARERNLEMARFLLDKGADATLPSTPRNHTPLHLATVYDMDDEDVPRDGIRDDDTTLLEILIQHGADVRAPAQDSLGASAWMKGEELHERLFSPYNYDQDFEDCTPLHFAVLSQCGNTVKVLLAAGADIHAQTSVKGSTPLHLAAAGFCRGMIRLLLENGANLQLIDYGGRKMIHHLLFICRRKPEKVKEFLLEEGIYDPSMEEELDLAEVYRLMLTFFSRRTNLPYIDD